ncbi:oxysterol-binding protein 1 [Clonorchis sinensis]|uniref:Oxysterol-binding protein 1 n=1 Tax=Clonorchis sinensis TaxID=79923 RepID=G7YD05_CLOSI|nr:oxysterol-binding protein 1 [Clonorchis sinensis]
MDVYFMLTCGPFSYTVTGDDSDAYTEGDDDDEEGKNSTMSADDAIRLVNQTLAKMESQLKDLQHHQETLVRKGDDLQRAVAELESARDPTELMQRFSSVRERATVYKVVSLAMVNSCARFTTLGRSQTQRWRRIFNSQRERCALLEQMIEELAKQLRQLELLVRQNNPQATLTLSGFSGGAPPLGGNVSSRQTHGHLSSIPGQAVRVADVQNKSTDESSAPVLSVEQCADSPSQPVPPPASRLHSENKVSPVELHVGMPTVRTSLGDSSDDDFFDAEEVSSEFSVYLPPTPHVVPPEFQGQAALHTASTAPVLGEMKEDDTSSTVISIQDDDSSFPTGTDVAFEYESDVEFAEEEYGGGAPHPPAHLREARVIQARPRRSGTRTGTLVSGGDAELEKSEPEHEKELAERRTSATVYVPVRKMVFQRRTSIPPKPNYSLNLWSIMKNCIGKELTKIPMPVNFSEPLSMLQRLTETFEYSSCLDRGALCNDSLEQMVHVAAFTISAYASTAVRVNKPFNPLLGETYECDRTDDLGWRCLAEQVTGAVTDKSGAVRYVLNGTWDESIEYAPVISTRTTQSGKPVLETGTSRVAWVRNPLPPEADRMYYFTPLAVQLNEPEEGVCPTDCRLRPDQRLMELGRWDEANREKVILEEKQRHRRREKAAQLAMEALNNGIKSNDPRSDSKRKSVSSVSSSFLSESVDASSSNGSLIPAHINNFLDQVDSAHTPLWFERKTDPDTGELIFQFTGAYWDNKAKGDWSMCPDIY